MSDTAYSPEKADTMQDQRQSVAEMRTQIAAVHRLHRQVRFGVTTSYCKHCSEIALDQVRYPCPTVRALVDEDRGDRVGEGPEVVSGTARRPLSES